MDQLDTFRTTLLMAIYSNPHANNLDINVKELEEWYRWFHGPELMGTHPAPPLKEQIIAERAAWHRISQEVYKQVPLRQALDNLKKDALFWMPYVSEVRRGANNSELIGNDRSQQTWPQQKWTMDQSAGDNLQRRSRGQKRQRPRGGLPQYPNKWMKQAQLKSKQETWTPPSQEQQWKQPEATKPPKGKGKGKGKEAKGKGKGKDKSKSGGKTKSKGPRWASANENGTYYCWDFAQGTCQTPGQCQKLHKCPIMPDGTWVCNGKHPVSACPYTK